MQESFPSSAVRDGANKNDANFEKVQTLIRLGMATYRAESFVAIKNQMGNTHAVTDEDAKLFQELSAEVRRLEALRQVDSAA